MHFWKWTAFVPQGVISSDSVSSGKAYLHFFPGALGVSAPYPVQAIVELFARGEVIAHQGFEGLRLNQPDGLELGAIFPQLPETQSEHLGVSIQLGIQQARVDLSLSRVMMELVFPSHRVRFHAVSPGKQVQGFSHLSKDEELVDGLEERVYPHAMFRSQLVEIDPEPRGMVASPEPLAPVTDYDDMADSQISDSEMINSDLNEQEEEQRVGYSLNSKILEEPMTLQNKGYPVTRFLAQYEVTSSLPVSVRCL